MPARKFIFLLWVDKNPIIELLAWVDIAENTNNGKPIPIPNDKNLTMLAMKSTVVMVGINKAAMNNGLQGITIPPKKNPYRKAPRIGFSDWGVLAFGRYLAKSILKISKMLINIKIPNAIGETISITFVREAFRMVVKTKPSNDMKTTTPTTTISPYLYNGWGSCPGCGAILFAK